VSTSITNRLNTFLLVMLVLMAAAIIAILASRAGAGPLDPPGAPNSTLPQVEPRMPIPPVGWNSRFPIVVSQPGSYFLTKNLIAPPAADGIDIITSNVTIDLNGFSLAGERGAGDGINASSGTAGIVIKNGSLSGWHRGVAIPYSGESRVEDVGVFYSDTIGIDIGDDSIVSHVVSSGNVSVGVQIEDPYSYYRGGLIEDSVLTRNGDTGLSIRANNVTARRNVVDSNHITGVYVIGNFEVVMDNTIQGTDTGYCVNVAGTSNTVARNILRNCHSGYVSNFSLTNLIGPSTVDLNTSQTWSNVFR
jgi:hypothetical protein